MLKFPDSKIYFLTDMHADAAAFRRSMERCEKDSIIVIGGDTFDKGPSNLELLREYKKFIRDGWNFKFVIGNHDVRQYMVLKYWFQQGDPKYAAAFTAKRFRSRINPLLHECGGIEKAQQMFLSADGEFNWFFRDQILIYRNNSFAFVHAGISDLLAETIEQTSVFSINLRFRAMMNTDPFALYYGSLGSAIRTKYRDNDFAFTPHGTATLRKTGISAIVSGHFNVLDGHELKIMNGTPQFFCDCVVDSASRKKYNMKTPGWAVLEIDPHTRKIIGRSSEKTLTLYEE